MDNKTDNFKIYLDNLSTFRPKILELTFIHFRQNKKNVDLTTSFNYPKYSLGLIFLFLRKRRDSNPRAALATYTLSRGASSANLSTFPMAPQVGLEPTTDRLTADSSTTELLWINSTSYQAQILLYQLQTIFQVEILKKYAEHLH